ncbi:MAG: carboxypeptidase-like regulatory domain-containing protein [Bacteroidota bacterium]|nr:carboxypeptidase-like regulatory domain-containing protein [Bacteroidota bacterium]
MNAYFRIRFLFCRIAILLLFYFPVEAQPVLYTSIKGCVLDQQTQSPLSGATIILEGSNPLIGTVSDENGRFRLPGIPIGKKRIKVTYVGYLPFLSDDIILSSGKEATVTVYLKESAISAKEVEIRGDYHKYESLNKMATVSVRSFSVDETFRFAGSYNDPARMAQNFAGVTSGIDNRNDIIVRGNTPMGLQWRLDDMEIPNPNHFAAVGTTGGPVTILNDNLLTNSDFYSGAFPAQYGNALSGIFDMRMRIGNNEKREYWAGMGWNGLEIGTEGPFSKKSGASYLFSYRYSLLDLAKVAGIHLINIDPQYQDINFKFSIPTKKAGTFTITGIGGISYIQLFDSPKKQSEWMFSDRGEDLANGSNLGVLGIQHQIYPDHSLKIKTMIYLVSSLVYTRIDTFSINASTPSIWAGERSSETKVTGSFEILKKLNPKNSLNGGITYDHYFLDYADSAMWKGSFLKNTDSRENMDLIRGYTQWQNVRSSSFDFTAGIFGSILLMNHTWALEPRFGLNWNLSAKHRIDFGTGLYSQMQPRVIYFLLDKTPEGSLIQTNRNLNFTRDAQIALGYNFIPSENLRFKTEVYFQYLYDIPVKPSIPSFSLLNSGHEFFLDRQYSDSLINKGTGMNYGIELTMERFYHMNYYFLFTASLFDSRYKGYDGKERSTAFNVNYVLNAVGGYEFIMGKRKWGVMSVGLRATYAGGNPYLPFDVDASKASGESIYDWSRAYQSRFPDYKRLSLRFGIKRNLPGRNMEFVLDLQYRTNYTNVYLQRIDPKTGEIKEFFQMGFFPMGTWRVQF